MALFITFIILLLILISFIIAYIIFKRFYDTKYYYIINIKPLRYTYGKGFIQKIAFFISNCKSIPKLRGKHNLILDITNVGKKTLFRIIVPENYLKDYHKIFSSNYPDFQVTLGGKFSEKEFLDKYKSGIVFRTELDTPFLREELIEEKIGENIKSIVTGVTDGSFQLLLNFNSKTEIFANSNEIEDVKIENTLASSNINFVKDIGVSFRFLSFNDNYIETTMPGLVGGILNLGGKFDLITKYYKNGTCKFKYLNFSKRITDLFYRLINGSSLKLSSYSPADEMFFNSKEISYIYNFVPSDNSEVLQYKSFSPIDAIKYQEDLISKKGENSFTKVAQFDYPGVNDKYFMLDEQTLRRHAYIIGKTGMGKTTALKILIKDDIDKGRGFSLLDPNGDVAEEILDIIPDDRKDDVIYIDPSVYLGRVCLSVFSFLKELRHYQQEYEIDQHNQSKAIGSEHDLYHMETEDKFMSMIVSMMKAVSVGGKDFWGPRMDKIMKEVGTATLKYDISEISDISYYLNVSKYRQLFIKAIENEDLKESLLIFENKVEKERDEAFQPVRNRFDVFLSDTMKNIFSGKPKFSLRQAIDSGKIIILRLPKGTMGDSNSSLLGTMMVALYWAMAQTRISIPENERKDFTLYIDEFQNFVTDSFSQMLEEARKYRLRLVLANQFTKQIKHRNESVFDSIKGNIGTFIALGLGSDDSLLLSKYFGIDALDMVNLPPLRGYVKCEEYSPTPFNIKMDHITKDPNKIYPGRTFIKNLSYSKYGIASDNEEVSDQFVIKKRNVFKLLLTLEYFDKNNFFKLLKIKKIAFDKLLDEMFFEGILLLNDDGTITINFDKVDVNDTGYFDIEYNEIIKKEKSYISLGRYFKEFKKLPSFGYNIDSYNRDIEEKIKDSKTDKLLVDKDEVFDIYHDLDLDGFNGLNEDKLDIIEKDGVKLITYQIKLSDVKKTILELISELGFNDFSEFQKYNHNNELNLNESTIILKKFVGKKLYIKV